MTFTSMLFIALFIEAIVGALKPLWSQNGAKMSVAEIVSIVIGIALAVALKIDLLYYIVGYDVTKGMPVWAEYIFYVLTGVAIGRGPSFLYDLWMSVKEWGKKGQEEETEKNDIVDLNVSHWSLEMLKSFCEGNEIPAEGCETKEDFLKAIEAAARDE